MTKTTAEQQIRQALEQILIAADDINNPDDNAPSETLEGRNNALQGLILQAWEKLAVLTGNRDLARRNGFESIEPERPIDGDLPSIADWTVLQYSQPIIPFHRLDDPLQAMGCAMFHIGAAVLQYGIIQDFPAGVPGDAATRRGISGPRTTPAWPTPSCTWYTRPCPTAIPTARRSGNTAGRPTSG